MCINGIHKVPILAILLQFFHYTKFESHTFRYNYVTSVSGEINSQE